MDDDSDRAAWCGRRVGWLITSVALHGATLAALIAFPGDAPRHTWPAPMAVTLAMLPAVADGVPPDDAAADATTRGQPPEAAPRPATEAPDRAAGLAAPSQPMAIPPAAPPQAQPAPPPARPPRPSPSPRPMPAPSAARPGPPPSRPMSPGSAVSGPDAATATEPPPPSPALAPATISGIWAAAVAAWVQRHKSYPEEARRNGQEGRATVRITIRRDGTVLEAALLQATGADVLDHAVMTMLRGARLPPFPDGMPQPQVSVTIPIAYMLGR